MEIIKYKKIYLTVSALLVVAGIASMAVFGFKQGIDFVGGTHWQVRFISDDVSISAIRAALENQEDALVRQGENSGDFSIRMRDISEERHQELAGLVEAELGEFEELSFASIGPAIGRELRSRALLAFVLVLIGISLYIAFAFRKVSYPVSSWKYGVTTLVTLFHDALISAGVFAFWGWQYGVEADTNFIVAILVIMGFSVHDTIVVFDRIRENLLLSKRNASFDGVINDSINQTLARSVNTSLTLVLVLVALYFFGASSLSFFTLLILIGTLVGTYSSIFVASPLLTFLHRK